MGASLPHSPLLVPGEREHLCSWMRMERKKEVVCITGNGLFSSPRAVQRMNSLLGLAVLFAWGLSPAHGSLLELYQMVTEATGRNALLNYASYGCHCGLGGQGQPKDATDRCCQLHDTCYDNLLNYQCDAKTEAYHYNWNHGRLFCGNYSPCSYWSCECDRDLALCLRRNVRSYRKRYRFYPKENCC